MYVDPIVAAERVFAADRGDVEKYESVEDAKQQLMARTMEENTRFKDIYGVDNLDYANYDMIIDSTSATPEQIANAIAVNAKRFEEKPFGYTLLLLSDKNVIDESDGLGNALISVKDDKYYLVSGKIEKEADVFVKAEYIAK